MPACWNPFLLADDLEGETPLFRLEAILAANDVFRGERTRLVPIRLQVICSAVVGLVVICCAWALQLEITRREVVQGELTPRNGEVVVRAARPGVIEALYVAEGQSVRRHDVLARIVSAADGPDGARVSRQLAESLETQKMLLEDQRVAVGRTRDIARRDSTARIAHLREQRGLAVALHDVQARRHRFAQQRFARVGAIEDRRFLSDYVYGELRDGVLALEQGVAEGLLRQRGIEQEITALRLAAERRQQEFAVQLAEIDARLAGLRGQQLREGANWWYEITAPRNGTVAGLSEDLGDSVVAGQALLSLVSPDARLKARLFAPTRSAARLEPGLPVALRVAAYPFQKFGTVQGHLRTVSDTTVVVRGAAAASVGSESVYLLEVSLDQQYLDHAGVHRALRPGMEVTAELTTDRRPLGAWLFESLTALY
jgi:membrane fusion protein